MFLELNELLNLNNFEVNIQILDNKLDLDTDSYLFLFEEIVIFRQNIN